MDIISNLPNELRAIETEMCDLVFDYFNIIQQQYDVSRQKWAKDKTYLMAIGAAKQLTDRQVKEQSIIPTSLTE